jgi:hypothetical protein
VVMEGNNAMDYKLVDNMQLHSYRGTYILIELRILNI